MIDYVLTFGAGFAAGLMFGNRPQYKTPRLVSRFAKEPAQVKARPVWHIGEWELNLQSFAVHGDMCNFSSRVMCYEWQVCTEPAWDDYMMLLETIKAVQRIPRRKTQWREGWGVRTLHIVIKRQLIAIPFPDKPAHVVSATLNAPQSPQLSAVSAD